MTATREDVLVRPIRPKECDALGELKVAAFAPVPGANLAGHVFDPAAGISGMSERRRAFGAVPSCTWV